MCANANHSGLGSFAARNPKRRRAPSSLQISVRDSTYGRPHSQTPAESAGPNGHNRPQTGQYEAQSGHNPGAKRTIAQSPTSQFPEHFHSVSHSVRQSQPHLSAVYAKTPPPNPLPRNHIRKLPRSQNAAPQLANKKTFCPPSNRTPKRRSAGPRIPVLRPPSPVPRPRCLPPHTASWHNECTCSAARSRKPPWVSLHAHASNSHRTVVLPPITS